MTCGGLGVNWIGADACGSLGGNWIGAVVVGGFFAGPDLTRALATLLMGATLATGGEGAGRTGFKLVVVGVTGGEGKVGEGVGGRRGKVGEGVGGR